eukprot:gene5290-7062_t
MANIEKSEVKIESLEEISPKLLQLASHNGRFIQETPNKPFQNHRTITEWATLSPFLTKKGQIDSTVKKYRRSNQSRKKSKKSRKSSGEPYSPVTPIQHQNGFIPEPHETELFIQAQKLAEQTNSNLATSVADPSNLGSSCENYQGLESHLQSIVLGEWEIPIWYASAYPQTQPHDCHPPHPPGDEIYRREDLSLWEIDGSKKKVYCQNLSLLSKLFLDSKTLWRDVEPFMFYVLTIWAPTGADIVGYFSKEKDSVLNFNLSCIMTLPMHQRKGYGQAMIELSYLLTRKESKVGSPEKPLSDLGLLSYRQYWTTAIFKYLENHTQDNTFSIENMSQQTGITPEDIVSTLQALRMVKAWRGKYVIVTQPEALQTYQRRQAASHISIDEKPHPFVIDPACLRWAPLIIPQPK